MEQYDNESFLNVFDRFERLNLQQMSTGSAYFWGFPLQILN
jgi:hypothetical protein